MSASLTSGVSEGADPLPRSATPKSLPSRSSASSLGDRRRYGALCLLPAPLRPLLLPEPLTRASHHLHQAGSEPLEGQGAPLARAPHLLRSSPAFLTTLPSPSATRCPASLQRVCSPEPIAALASKG